MRDNKYGYIWLIMLALGWGIVGFYIGSYKNDTEIIEPTYSIYTYDYNTTTVYRYMDNKLVYEYSYSGNHLVQIIEGSEQITIIDFDDQDKAKEFCYSYMYDLQMEDKL